MALDITLTRLSKNTLLSLPQKNLPQPPSSNVPVKGDAAPAADKFTMSSEALARVNAEKNNVDASPQGSGKLTLADLNGEGANLVALQTRQHLGTQSLSLVNQAPQTLLHLFA